MQLHALMRQVGGGDPNTVKCSKEERTQFQQ